MSPLHLVLPVFELTAEVRVADGFGIAAIAGIGAVTAEDSSGEDHRFSAYELGAQLVFYPLEAFDSLQVGAEALYIKVEREDDADADVSGVADGFALGPLVGYKLITNVGFTFVVQGGVQYVAYRAETTDGSGTSSDSESRFIPLLNLNLGWSF